MGRNRKKSQSTNGDSRTGGGMGRAMDRREFLERSAAAITGLTALPWLSGCGGFSATQLSSSSMDALSSIANTDLAILQALGAAGKNVLFIAVDDLNDYASPFGGYKGPVHTPNMERLAKKGVVFNNAYCTVPWCGPSRTATLSGVSPTRSNYYGTGNIRGNPALANVTTLPGFFRQNGYKTYAGGKVFHGEYAAYGNNASNVWKEVDVDRVGSWDHYESFTDEPRPPSGPNNGLNIPWSQFDWSPQFNPAEDQMPDRLMAKWASDLLRNSHPDPFFLAVGFYRPHLPWYAPRRFYDMYPLDSIRLPEFAVTDDLADLPPSGIRLTGKDGDHARLLEKDPVTLTYWKQAIQAYLASVSFFDTCLGLVLDGLEQGPHAKDTVIVLWSDNGFQLGEKLGWRKFKMWEQSARVPMIIAMPSGINAGTRCDRPVSLLDLYPTLAELCLARSPANVDGNSLAPLLQDPKADWCYGAVTTFAEDAGNPNILHRSVRTENYRLIRYANGDEELYDHRNDPNEWKNLLHPSNNPGPQIQAIRNTLAALLS